MQHYVNLSNWEKGFSEIFPIWIVVRLQTHLMSALSEIFADWKNHRFFTFSSGELKSFLGLIIEINGTSGNPILQFKEQNP